MGNKNTTNIKKVLIMAATSLMLAGCKANPDTPIVQNKDLDNMISNAESTEENSKKADTVIQETAQKYHNYITDIKDDSFFIDVKVDAKVEVPGVDKLSVVRVKRKTLGDDFLNKFLSVCEPDTKFVPEHVYTKAEYEDIIQGAKEEVNTIETKIEQKVWNSGEISEEELYTALSEAEARLNSYQERYENAPETITAENLEPYVVEPKMVSVADELSKDPDSDFYKWESDLGTSELFRGTNNGIDGRYVTVYIQQNEDVGNLFRYMVSNTGEIKATSVVGDMGTGIRNYAKTNEELKLYYGSDLQELTKEAAADLSVDEAKAQAQELLDKLDITDFTCDSADLYYNCPEGLSGYRMVYVVEYNRQIDGVMVDNSGGYMSSDSWNGGEYNLKTWSEEKIRVFVNDDGIAGFEYESPLELTDTVVENSSIKDFDEIKDIFEKMVIACCAEDNNVLDDELSEDIRYATYTIKKVVLRYTRVSEQDSFDTGLMVPVWDFIGDVEYGDYSKRTEPETDKVILTINAIDGTIIDRTVGY